MSNSEELTAVALGITQTLTLWTALAPNVKEIRRADPVTDRGTVDDLRTAEAVVGSIAVLVGTVSAVHMHSLMPLLATGVTVIGLIATYELTLRNTPNL